MASSSSLQLGPTLARHLREVYTGGNWTSVNLQQELRGLPLESVLRKLPNTNNIATLACHMTYYVDALVMVLQGGALTAKDALSFEVPPLPTQADWEKLVDEMLHQAEQAAVMLEQMPDERFAEPFAGEKYGSWFRNVMGMIEHLHYHLGQIVLLKKLEG